MRWATTYRFKRVTIQLVLFISLLAGLGLARTVGHVHGWWLILSASGAVAGYRYRSIFGLICVVSFGVSLGWWRGDLFIAKLRAYQPWYNHAVTVDVVSNEDAVYGTNSQLAFKASHVTIREGPELNGVISVSGFGPSAVFQGDDVEVSGKLMPGYGADQAELSFGKLTVLAHHDSPINELRRRFTAGMQTALPEPLASFAMGLLIGQRATLPTAVKQDLLMVGLTHIIAVSGYNLTIILHASKRLLAKQSKRLSTLLSLSLIIVFLLLAGASASIVRAAIVSTLSITTLYYGRSVKPLNLITMTAAITGFINPIYVWSDISWYLSFLAFFGVMILSPLIAERLPFKHESVLVSVALESICAETMSLPIILYTFGQMSLIGLPANVLVVALIPLGMLLSLIAGLAGMLIPTVAGWVAWPARLLLHYMLDVAHLLAGLPHVFVENLSLSLTKMLLWYGGIVLFIMA